MKMIKDLCKKLVNVGVKKLMIVVRVLHIFLVVTPRIPT